MPNAEASLEARRVEHFSVYHITSRNYFWCRKHAVPEFTQLYLRVCGGLLECARSERTVGLLLDKTAVKSFFEGAVHRARTYKIRNVRITIANVDIQRDCQFGKAQTVSDLARVVRLRGRGYIFISLFYSIQRTHLSPSRSECYQ